jgi:hypothetical protein
MVLQLSTLYNEYVMTSFKDSSFYHNMKGPYDMFFIWIIIQHFPELKPMYLRLMTHKVRPDTPKIYTKEFKTLASISSYKKKSSITQH